MSLLEIVATIELPRVRRFVGMKHFKVNTRRNAQVKIALTKGNFAGFLVDKIEENIPLGAARVHRLCQPSLDAQILTALGETREMYLADIWALLKRQPGGQAGPLLVNGWANIFYVRDREDQLWAVFANWYPIYDGWRLRADSVEPPHTRSNGLQIISR